MSIIQHQFSNVPMYVSLFVFIFSCTLVLIWFGKWKIGFRYLGLLYVFTSLLHGLFSLFLSNANSIFSTKIAEIAGSSKELAQIQSDIIHTILVSFAKLHVLFSLYVLVIGLVLYFAVNKFEKS